MRLIIATSGQINLWPPGGGYLCSARGFNTNGPSPPGTQFTAGALLGRIGENGPVFLIGESHDSVPNRDSVLARMQWLLHPNNHHLLHEELVDLRLKIYLATDTRRVAPQINAVIQRHDDFLIPLESLRCETLFLWTQDNPIHDLEAARAAAARVPASSFYLMQADAAHWPQYEAPQEFNSVAASYFATGKLPAAARSRA